MISSGSNTPKTRANSSDISPQNSSYNNSKEVPTPTLKIDDILESLVIGQNWKNDTRLVLFVVLRDHLSLDSNLTKVIKNKLRTGASPRHVPSIIVQAPEIPKTKSGKIVELAVRDLINGKEIKNISALANPECLDFYRSLSI